MSFDAVVVGEVLGLEGDGAGPYGVSVDQVSRVLPIVEMLGAEDSFPWIMDVADGRPDSYVMVDSCPTSVVLPFGDGELSVFRSRAALVVHLGDLTTIAGMLEGDSAAVRVGWDKTRQWSGPHEQEVGEYVRRNNELAVGTAVGAGVTVDESGKYVVLGEQDFFTLSEGGTVVTPDRCEWSRPVLPSELRGMRMGDLEAALSSCHANSTALPSGEQLRSVRLQDVSGGRQLPHFGAQCTIAFSGTPLGEVGESELE